MYRCFCHTILGESNRDEYCQPHQGNPGESNGVQETERGTEAQGAAAERPTGEGSHAGSY